MGETLDKKGPRAVVAEVVHMGEQLIVPDGMKIPEAIELLQRREKFLEEPVAINESFPVFPWDGAYALEQVLRAKFGWATAEPTPGFFGKNPPQMIAIDIGPRKVHNVPWGRFSIPTVKEGYVQCGVDQKDGLMCFRLTAAVKRKDEETIKALFAAVREYLKTNSIYRGQAIKIRFTDDNGEKLEMPEPKFMATDDFDERLMVYPEEVAASIETNLFTPIARHADLKANGISIKRGVLLGGPYGTGKTLAAKVAAKRATDNGVTFVYVARADELAQAVAFAKQYQEPMAAVFCEDIDRAVHGERTIEMDEILNIIDGIDTKSANIMVILTTNHLDNINPAMLRPGRLDAVIDVLPPDGPAVEKLLRVYGGENLAETTNLHQVGELLSGTIPAVIAEVVKRAKLSQLSLQKRGEKVTMLTESALIESASTMQAQLRLLNKDRAPKELPSIESVIKKVVDNSLVQHSA
jgi:transitional endoplasmic reticulum ATPase